MATTATAAASPARPAVRRLGRFELLQLLGKSERSMLWRVHDPRAGQELLLALPRVQPAHAAALDRWQQAVRKAARLNHPHLAPVVEVGEQERWPYVAYDRTLGLTLPERAGRDAPAPVDVARQLVQALDGLAFAHEAGVAHGDLQPFHLLVADNGQVRLLGFEIALAEAVPEADAAALARNLSMDPTQLQAQRQSAERDVLAIGLILHRQLAHQPVLEEEDLGRVIARMPPGGPELVRLPWSLPRPVPEALRAIANRCTDRQERHRYRSARTLSRALQGSLDAEASNAGGALSLLLDRVRAHGALPSAPGGSVRVSQLMRMERERTNELAEIVLRDLALSFELLRLVNTADAQLSANGGAVLTLRRAIALLGLQGVQRAAQALRPWPGNLQPEGAQALAALIHTVQRAGRVAQALRPAGYDREVVHLVTLLQNLGRLVVHAHFPDEAVQLRKLMQSAPSDKPGEADEPGMTEEQASFAVLGADVQAMGLAVARQWGLDDSVLHMVRRLPLGATARAADGDDDLLRALASAANETVDASALPAAQVVPALQRVAQRYGRALGLTLKDLQQALQLAATPGGDDTTVGGSAAGSTTDAEADTLQDTPQRSEPR
jgi:non-specific serine/threonine protein kinase